MILENFEKYRFWRNTRCMVVYVFDPPFIFLKQDPVIHV